MNKLLLVIMFLLAVVNSTPGKGRGMRKGKASAQKKAIKASNPGPRVIPIIPEESFVQAIKTVPEFLEYLHTYPSVIIDFHAPSCGPCRKMSPKFNELARNNPSVKFLSVNLDEAEERLCAGVEAMPTFVLWTLGEDGPEVIDDILGANLKGLINLVKIAPITNNHLETRSESL